MIKTLKERKRMLVSPHVFLLSFTQVFYLCFLWNSRAAILRYVYTYRHVRKSLVYTQNSEGGVFCRVLSYLYGLDHTWACFVIFD